MNGNRTAFTLVEIMIVVVIMGILAATVVPQFVNVGDDSNVKTRDFNLKALKGQIALYRSQTGTYPSGLSDLIPNYLTSVPENPVTNGNTSNDTMSDPIGTYLINTGGWDYDWYYNMTNGKIWAMTL